ncbi:response regulator transcription factor [Parasalinivibrio latis]|uniref:response regulator transcription factor n=1 Tax=Parasalinivibrio latis TaxID=2952610 RepID=UPI0030E404D8
MSKILVVEDDLAMCELLQEVLIGEGFEVCCAHCGEAALESIKKENPSLILLEVMLPKIDGITLARHISSQSLTPIIMLTARDDEATMLEGYAAGADHFLSKPFKVPELLVRIQAILRRVGKQQTHLNLETHKENGVSSLQMLKEKVSGLPLTETELSLVTYLINHHDIVVDKSRLQMDVLKKELSPFDRNLDMHVSNIRRKFNNAGLSKQHIKTIRGKGYCFVLDLKWT